MKMYKKVMAAALAGVMTVSMSATAFAADDDGYILKATNEDSKSSDNDLVIAIEGSVSSMDPANIPDTNAISATTNSNKHTKVETIIPRNKRRINQRSLFFIKSFKV